MNLTAYEWSLIVVALLVVLACGLLSARRDDGPAGWIELYDMDGHLAERWRADAGGRR